MHVKLRTLIALLLVSILLACVFPVLAYPAVQSAPVTTEVRTYTNGTNATITIWAVGFPAYSLVRLDKVADELSIDGVNRYRFNSTITLYADAGGSVYYTDMTTRINSFYTFTFVANDGGQLVVPVTTQVSYLAPRPVTTICYSNPALPSRLSIGDNGRALYYQTGYTRATSDGLYSDETNIALNAGVVFTVLSGPVCDGQGASWLKVVTMNTVMEHDQIMYVMESNGSNYLLEPTGTSEAVANWRLLPGDTTYWSPASSRFRINVRPLPTWCQDEYGTDRAPRFAQIRYGELVRVTAITSDTRWVQVVLPNGSYGWVPTHLGSINFFAPYIGYDNISGVFVQPPPVSDPVPAWGNCDW